MKWKLMILFVCLLTSVSSVLAQQKVTGVVLSSEDNEPIIGASVYLKGSKVGAITDSNGRFSLSVPRGTKTLVVSFVGMKTKEVAIKPNLTIFLENDFAQLDEVVVTAQGITRKAKSLGYSTQEVKGEKLTMARQTDLGNAMAGKISGARFFGASGATFDTGSIVLRGTTTFTDRAGSEPIYVVDGTITNKNVINMDDVESINVLKGPAATALYGSEGGNGAVIITTKKAKDGKGSVEVSHSITFENYYNHFKMQRDYGGGSLGASGESLDAKYGSQYDTMSADFLYGTYKGWKNSDGSYYMDYGSDESWGARFDSNVKMASALYYDSTSSKYQKADPWVAQLDMKDLFRTGINNTTNVAFSKSGKDYSTRVSFTNSDRTGIYHNSQAIRRFLGVKATYSPKEWMNIVLDYKYTYRRNKNSATEGYGENGNTFYDFVQWGHTNVNLKDYKDYQRGDGTWRTWNIISPDNLTANFHDNPFAVADNFNHYSTDQWSVLTGDMEIKLPYNFKAGVRVMANLKNNNSETKVSNGAINFSSQYAESQYHTRELTVQGRLTWGNRYINDRLTVDAGIFTEQKNYSYGYLTASTASGLGIDGFFNLSNSNSYVTASNTVTEYKTRSIFGTATVGFDDTYFLDGSLRNDWDSKLPKSSNSYLYGGLSASVLVSNFFKELKWLNYWKVRGSLAQVGSTLAAYAATTNYLTSTAYGSKIRLYQSASQKNQNIKPTISTSYELGTEFRMFDNRFWGDINVYIRDTKNQIINATVAPQSGYSSRQINAGLVRNKGIEISLGGTVLKNKDFQWDIDANIAKNVNKLVSLNEGISDYTLTWNRFYYNFTLKAEVGKPIGVLYTSARWAKDDNGKQKLTASTSASWGGGYRPTYDLGTEKEVGNFQPDWTGGFSTNVRFRDFRLGASFDYMIGGKMVSWTNLWATGSGMLASTSQLNNNGVNEREPISKGGGVHVQGVDASGNDVDCYINAYNYYHYKAYYGNDDWIYSRTYLKMRELSLTYNVPSSFLAKTKTGIESFSLSFIATNPWLIYSACPNVDPSETGTNWLEGGQAPATRSWGLTVKLSF